MNMCTDKIIGLVIKFLSGIAFVLLTKFAIPIRCAEP